MHIVNEKAAELKKMTGAREDGGKWCDGCKNIQELLVAVGISIGAKENASLKSKQKEFTQVCIST